MKMGTHTHQGEAGKDGKDDGGKDTRKISKDEAAFILGSQGKTKNKLANVSGAQIDLVELKTDKGASLLEIRGDSKQRDHAMKYIDYVLLQRIGPVKIDESLHPDDLTILHVPADTVSFITGTKGAYLRLVEDEWWTLLFFLMVNPKAPPLNVDPNHTERLAIFGPRRARRGAELKVMAAIEEKRHGYFTKNGCPYENQEEGFATDTMLISEEDYSYALGKSGNTRKKLARASSCIVEYIGRVAYFSGIKIERARAKEYLQWLLQQRVGEHARVDHKGREDVTVVSVPRNCLGYVNGHKGSSLRQIEEETSTFCFFESPADEGDDGQKQLLIFGRPEDRRFAESLVYERISHKMDEPAHDNSYSSGRKGKGRGKGDSGKGKGGNSRGDGRDGGRDGRDGGRDSGRNRTDWSGNDVERERPSGPGISSDFLTISEDDAAFLNGPKGCTKNKIAAVSGAFLELKNTKLEITGSKEQRERADKYVKIVMKQRLGPVMLEDAEEHDDLLIIEVPAAAVSFVTGRNGTFLRMVEEEFSTLLFFINFSKSNKRDQLEKLAIFGPERERRGAELKVMAAIETKQTGYFTNRFTNLPMCDAAEGYGMDRLVIEEDDYSYALGKFGATRKKIAKASGCVIEYIGRHAYLSGAKLERSRAREYLGWLFRQRVGPVEVDYSNRDDVTVLPVPKDCVGFVTGHKGTSLRAVEEATGTFCFIEGGRDDPHRDPKPLLIFGATDSRRVAQEMLQQRIDQKLEAGWVHEDYTYRGYQDSGKGDSKGGRKDGRRPPRGHKGGAGGEERSQAATANATAVTTPSATPSGNTSSAAAEKSDAATAPPPVAETKEEPVEQEDDEAWGDWGGASEDEPIDESSAGGTAGGGGSYVAEMGGHTPTTGGTTPTSAAKWLNQPVPVTYKASDLRGEELEMPPQLLHEEAWPELGDMGAKSGRKGKRR